MRLAAVDIGTNSTRLLVADVSGGVLREVGSKLITTRLGEGIGDGLLLKAPMERTLQAIAQCYQAALDAGAVQVAAAATCAVREAANQADFLEMARQRFGLAVRVLSGEAEAALSYRGVCAALPLEPAESVVLDVGGGSTELIWQRAGQVCGSSVPAGAVRVTAAALSEARIAAILEPALVRLRGFPVGYLAGVGGTITCLAAMAQEMQEYDPKGIHGYYLSAAAIGQMYRKLRVMSLAERKKQPGLPPERADIIGGGAAIVKIVLDRLGLPGLVVSASDLLQGLLLELAESC